MSALRPIVEARELDGKEILALSVKGDWGVVTVRCPVSAPNRIAAFDGRAVFHGRCFGDLSYDGLGALRRYREEDLRGFLTLPGQEP